MSSLKNLETLAAPEEKLSRAAKKAIKIIQSFMMRHDFQTGGCKTFYSPSSWKERDEKYGRDSELLVVYDGGDLYYVMNPHYADFPSLFYKYEAELMRELEEEGLSLEPCTHWYCAIYRSEDR